MGNRVRRVALAAAITLAALNVWTGGPLAALWIGSRIQGDGPPSMSAIFTAALSLAVISVLLLRILATLGGAYEQLTGTKSTVRTHVPWLRSMRGEREEGYEGAARPQMTLLERVLVVMVALAVIAFEIWFFFYSSSPIDQRTGRE